jgi:hypothetical protein
LPSEGNLGEDIDFIISHAVFNGCGYYSREEIIRNGNMLMVTFYAKYHEGFCTQDIPIRKTHYKYIPTQKGLHTFKGSVLN